MRNILLAGFLVAIPAFAQQAEPMRLVTQNLTLDKGALLGTPLVIKGNDITIDGNGATIQGPGRPGEPKTFVGVGVQAEGCAPVKAAFDANEDVVPCRGTTCADSIAVGHPRNWRKAIRGLRESGGTVLAVSDDEIVSAIAELGRATGIFGEPAGVTAFAGLAKAVREGAVDPDESIAVLMTGSGLKDTESAMRTAGQPIPVGRSLADVETALAERGTA